MYRSCIEILALFFVSALYFASSLAYLILIGVYRDTNENEVSIPIYLFICLHYIILNMTASISL